MLANSCSSSQQSSSDDYLELLLCYNTTIENNISRNQVFKKRFGLYNYSVYDIIKFVVHSLSQCRIVLLRLSESVFKHLLTIECFFRIKASMIENEKRFITGEKIKRKNK